MGTPATPAIVAAGVAFDTARTAFYTKRTELDRLLTDLDNKADETDAARARVAPPPPVPIPASSASGAAVNEAIARAAEAKDISARIDTELANLRTLLTALQTAKTNLDDLISNAENADNWHSQLLRGICNVLPYFSAQPLSTTAICPQRQTQLTGANSIPASIAALQSAINSSVSTAKDQAIQARIAQLRQEGHGPQRHSSAASTTAVKARACFNIDPAGGAQTEYVAPAPPAPPGAPPPAPPRLHKCAAKSSRVRNDEDYVKAEAEMRRHLMNQVCPPGGPSPPVPPDGRISITRLLHPLFLNPDAACEGFEDTDKANRPRVMTSLGVALQVPTVAGVPPFRLFGITDPPANPPTHPFAFPQPPQQQSNTRKNAFKTAAERAVAQGKDPQQVMDRMNAFSPAPPPQPPQTLVASAAQALAAAAAIVPPLRPPPTRAQLDHAAIDAEAAAATTVPTTFAGGNMFALYEVDNPANPCGGWKLVTMYPEPQ